MLKLRDFLHLPQLDAIISQLVKDGPGLIILAGIDVRSDISSETALPSAQTPSSETRINPSGLSAIFSILLQEILFSNPLSNAIVVSEDRSHARVPRQLQRRVGHLKVEPDFPYPYQIDIAAKQRPGLLVINRMTADNAPAVFKAAGMGLRVLTQFDTVLHGSAVVREMVDLGVPRAHLPHLRWVLTTQRMSALCPHCKTNTGLTTEQAARFTERYPHLAEPIDKILHPTQSSFQRRNVVREQAGFYRATGCERCKGTGYQGELSVFDLYRQPPSPEPVIDQPSLLSIEEYVLHLASQGEIDLDDLLQMERSHLRHTYHMLTSSEKALSTANSELSRKLLELEASNRVLVQRTEVLMSLEDLGQALISSTPLTDLASRVCRRAGDLCGADRVVLYLRRIIDDRSETAEILAARGWEIVAPGQQVPPAQVFDRPSETRATRFMHDPPGVRPNPSNKPPDSSTTPVVMGLRVPLFAQTQLVGVMIVQCTHKESFTPGEVALLQTFANQAALAIQRAGLVDDLRGKIAQLEAAQAELVTKERLERELELARQVQQAMLPRRFPEMTGFIIAADNHPARQVGGDFYDVIRLDEDHYGIVIADVADKGMPAALYMALTRSLLLAEARRARSPRTALINVNRLLLELGELSGFVSVFYGVIEASTGLFIFSRAGHERPFLLRDGQLHPLPGDGAVLGILEEKDLNLSEERTTLKPGDRLVLYTDGLTDVTNPDGQFFGNASLQNLLHRFSVLGAKELCQAIFDGLNEYRAQSEQFDDMTILVIEYQQAKKSNKK